MTDETKIVGPDGAPVGAPPEVFAAYDRAAPLGPPTALVREIPEWFREVHRWIGGRVEDEGLVLEMCLERAFSTVEFCHNKGLVGIDHFPEAQQGPGPTRTNLLMIAAPLATELYKQVLGSIERNRHEFERLVKEALERRGPRPS